MVASLKPNSNYSYGKRLAYVSIALLLIVASTKTLQNIEVVPCKKDEIASQIIQSMPVLATMGCNCE